jgi:hypothetical protein
LTSSLAAYSPIAPEPITTVTGPSAPLDFH